MSNHFINEVKVLSPKDFEEMFGDILSSEIQQKIVETNIQYQEATDAERDICIRMNVEKIMDESLVFSGEHRIVHWEAGWDENYKAFLSTGETSDLIPKYFGKTDFVKIKGPIDSTGGGNRFIKLVSRNSDAELYGICIDWLYDRYMKDAEFIYEFGCGPGHNLVRIAEGNKKTKIVGLDWAEASQKILLELSKTPLYGNITGQSFDYFNPDFKCTIPENAAVFTFGSLEQVGDRFKAFVNYLIKNKVKLCINVEPIFELLNQENLIDYLSLLYMKKRNYLDGYLTYLEQLEADGIIEVFEVKRLGLGSLYGESTGLVIWGVKGN